MKKPVVSGWLFIAALLLPSLCFAQYGGNVPVTGNVYLLSGSTQEILNDTTTNNGLIIALDISATVKLSGSQLNAQHVLLGGNSAYSQVGNLILNNGNGGLLIATSTYGLQVLSNLSFASGTNKIVTPRTALARTTNNLQLAANGSITGANANHTVDGYLQKISGSSFNFPLSQNGIYAPILINNIGSGNSVTAAYFASTYTVTTAPVGIASISNQEYWDVVSTGTISSVFSVTLGKNYTNYQAANTVLVGWNKVNNKWEQIATATPSSVNAGSTISSSSAISLANYSAFTIANTVASTTSAIMARAPDIIKTDSIPIATDLAITAFPNPTRGVISLSISGSSKIQYMVSVFDTHGKVLTKKSATGGSTMQIDLSNLSDGVYYVLVADDKGVAVKTIKIIKIK